MSSSRAENISNAVKVNIIVEIRDSGRPAQPITIRAAETCKSSRIRQWRCRIKKGRTLHDKSGRPRILDEQSMAVVEQQSSNISRAELKQLIVNQAFLTYARRQLLIGLEASETDSSFKHPSKRAVSRIMSEFFAAHPSDSTIRFVNLVAPDIDSDNYWFGNEF